MGPVHDGTESLVDGPVVPEQLVAVELEGFLAAVATRQMPQADAQASGVVLAEIVEAIHESARQGRPVDLDGD